MKDRPLPSESRATRPSKRATVAALVLLLTPPPAVARPSDLVNPIRPSPAPAGALSSPDRACATFPPVTSLFGQVYYVDPKNSVVDPKKQATDRAAAQPLERFYGETLRRADDYLSSGGADQASARCVIVMLDAWAKANALTGQFNYQGANHRKWALVALSVSFLAVRDAPTANPRARRRIARWLDRVGGLVSEPYRSGKIRNNHFYWAAAAAAAAGVASDDRDLYDWGISAARIGLGDIRGDGTLPLELARGDKALNYHAFSLTALTFIAALAEANGDDLYRDNGHALERLADLVIRNLDDSSSMARLAGAEQHWQVTSDTKLAWAEAYYARTRDQRLAKKLALIRPLTYKMMGNVTLLFGASDRK